jgi:hypothetical protein
MNQVCTKLLSSALFLLVYAACAQNNPKYAPAFYAYLKEQNLYAEQITYLNEVQSSCIDSLCIDTVLLSKAACYYSLNNVVACDFAIESIKNGTRFKSEKDKETYLSFLFLLNKKAALKENLTAADTTHFFYKRSKLFLQMLCRDKITAEKNDSLVLNDYQIQNISLRYKHSPHKSPLLAGLLSAAVPGLGKLYAGYKYQAFTAFTACVFMGAQAVEAAILSGVNSAHFIYTCSIFSAYYIGNIAGSAWAVKKKKRDHFNQIDNEINSYYSNLLGLSPN